MRVPLITLWASFVVGVVYSIPTYRDKFVTVDLYDSSDDGQSPDSKNLAKSTFVYQLDLDTTLHTALNDMIPQYLDATDEELSALRTFLKVVVLYFPVESPKTKAYLNSLKEFTESKNIITGEEFKAQVDLKEKEFGPAFPGPKEYIRCKPSDNGSPKGYPCGLWTLFHVLTVAAAESNHPVDEVHPPVLTAVHGFVKYFFGSCEVCQDNFIAIANNNSLLKPKSYDEAILWLWKAHNAVNAIVATEHPEYQKIQYPSVEDCPTCKVSNGEWDEKEVLAYLKNVYSSFNVIKTVYNKKITKDSVYQLDLDTTLHSALNDMIPQYLDATDEELNALRTFLKVIALYFPVQSPKTKAYINSLKEFAESKSIVTGEEFKAQVDLKEKEFGPAFPGPKEYIRCKPSDNGSPKGYPCGLWTLFHVLTVAAAESNHPVDEVHPPVLTAVHGFVKYFFGSCEVCQDNFIAIANNNSLFESKSHDEAILGLWKAHNAVNAIVATEHPEYQKIQYPSVEDCPTCKVSNGEWDEKEVLAYLKNVYSSFNVIKTVYKNKP